MVAKQGEVAVRVTDVMTVSPITVDANCRVDEALRLSRVFDVQHLVVVRRDAPLGMVCPVCDLGDARMDERVDKYMTRIVRIGAYATLEHARTEMCRQGVGALIVDTDVQDATWGIVTRGDLLRSGFACDDGLFFCASCGSHTHVHPMPGCDDVAFCQPCWDRAGPPRLGDDLGELD